MGAWGYEPWETDVSADWFAQGFKGVDFDAIAHRVDNFDSSNEHHYDEIRCAAFVLQKLCNPYIWRVNDEEDPRSLIEQAIVHLDTLIDTDKTPFLDMQDK